LCSESTLKLTIVLKSDNASMVTGAWSVLSATVAATAGFFAGKKA
jgi:2-methylisocitrate lyase-like PEP mutase family enzyme